MIESPLVRRSQTWSAAHVNMNAIFLLALFAFAAADKAYERQLLNGAVQLTSKMYTEVVKSNPGKSVVLSAFSVLPPLAQLSLASVGESHDELLHAMGLQNDNVKPQKKRFQTGNFDVNDEPRSGRPVTDKVDAILENVKQDRHIDSYDIAKELGIDHKTVFIHLKKAEYTKKLDSWVPDKLTERNTRGVFPAINQQLQTIKGVELKLANKIYIPQAYQLNKQFATDVKTVFDSEVKNIDFTQNTEAAREINQWVEDKTNNRIKNLVEPDSLGADTGAVLVNALYFKGSWKSKFDKALTTNRDFHVSADKTIKVPTMHKTDNFKYGQSDELNAKLLEIPYEGGEASLLVVLPNDVEGLSVLEKKLNENPALLVEATKRMHINKIDVFLPKFTIETTTDLKQVLQKIGVTKIFDANSARLEHLLDSDKPLFVSDAKQKAFIEVNEEGAEAAAANVVMVLFKSARVLRFSFVADRPFLFGLKIESPKTLLFSGTFRG
ncbi:hypothetical protein EVAR_29689_1 [Eumeta japonica]|uniref:Serpin domain-containing protein n=1 Tax=Eumeta variegata TaxID=151549 RepID=A0A4C1VXG9_EUMVA|nr:hypothetical protein EVAR_29689_1 [Eumeta japonica]